MPASSEQTNIDQDLLNFDTRPEEPPRKRSPGRRGHGRSRRKHERAGGTLEEDDEYTSRTQELTKQPSHVIQPRISPFTSQLDLGGNLDPSLEAYSEHTKGTQQNPPKRSTADWAGDVPYGRSPPQGKGVSLAGSPPRNEGFRGGFSHTSPPSSPRNAYRQLYHRDAEYQSFGGLAGASPPSARAPSMMSANSPYYAHSSRPPTNTYGVQDADFGTSKRRVPGTNLNIGHCYVFDTVSLASTSQQDVLLVGVENGLDVYTVDKLHFDRIGCLSGLPGRVVGATILPHVQQENDSSAVQPLVAVVVHGPCRDSKSHTGQHFQTSADDEFDASKSETEALESADMEYYQTSVEIYSLTKGEHITTLYMSPKVELQTGEQGAEPTPPAPVGGLSVLAKGRFLTVSSSISGEVLIFERLCVNEDSTSSGSRCIGKTWTRISSKKVRSVSTSSRESGHVSRDEDGEGPADQPIVSISARWLAVSSPPSSSQTSIHGRLGTSQIRKFPGESTHVSPSEPQTTCELDVPEAESLINRMARDATQEFVKGAKWVGTQGLQAWNKYWSKPTDQTSAATSASSPRNEVTSSASPHSFPPTHAQEIAVGRARVASASVSILDLEKLSENQHLKESTALQPVATFSAPNGCSLLSFAPTGLQLFTANAKGDIQQIWDLTRIIHGEIGRTSEQISGPSIREIARFTRMTEARLIDITWTRPRGKKLAVVTDNGTVHAYSLPPSAFLWPPLRRGQRSTALPGPENKTRSPADDLASTERSGGAINSTLNMFSGKTQPLFSAVRGRSTSAASPFSGLGGFASQAGAQGGKAIAAGINRSFTAAASGTVETLRHLGENRINLPGNPRSIRPGCISWFSQRDATSLAVSASGWVRVYGIQQSQNTKATKRRPSTIGKQPSEYTIPQMSRGKAFSDSFWHPPDNRPDTEDLPQSTHPLSYAEIETHAPYQPFHTDGRVTFFHYYNNNTSQADGLKKSDDAVWIFGEEISATKVSTGWVANEEDESEVDGATATQMGSVVRKEGDEQEGQEITARPRRKRHQRAEAAAVEDGEFFEDDLEFVDFAHDRV